MNRFERILTAFLAILLIAVLALGALVWLRPGIGMAPPLPDLTAPVAPTPSLARNTALLAFSAARAEAQSWQPDAQLVQAAATWTQGASREDLVKGTATWDFTFYSPAAGAVAVISVIEDEPRLITERAVSQALTLPDISGWRLDSPDAVARALQQGGEDFMRSAGATTMTASLSTARTEGKIEWFISLISKYSGDSFTMRLDASNGELLAVESSS